MSWWLTGLPLLIGLALLIFGGMTVVSNAVTLAARLGISKIIIGIVIVGFGTSAPELVTGVQSAREGVPTLSYGNVIGANIANLLMVMGVAALLVPVTVRPEAIRRDAATVLLAFSGLLALVWTGAPARLVGAALVLGLVVYLSVSWNSERRPRTPEDQMNAQEAAAAGDLRAPAGRALILLLTGLAALIVGADLLVADAVNIARRLGVSEGLIGLTVVSVGTCLPELVTAIVASLRKQGDVVTGNVLGSCLFNVMGVAGVVMLLSGTGLTEAQRLVQAPLMMVSGLVLISALISGARLHRLAGLTMLGAYAAFVAASALVDRI